MDYYHLVHLLFLFLTIPLLSSDAEYVAPSIPVVIPALPVNPSPSLTTSPPPPIATAPPIKPYNPPPKATTPPPKATAPQVKPYTPLPKATAPPIKPYTPPPKATVPPVKPYTPPPKATAPPVKPYTPPPKTVSPPVVAPPKSPSPPMATPPAPAPYYGHGPPVKKDECVPLCEKRCGLHSRKRLCVRACSTCCVRCKCVPPGTYGNKEVCGRCWTDMTTHGGRPKCP